MGYFVQSLTHVLIRPPLQKSCEFFNINIALASYFGIYAKLTHSFAYR